MIDALDAARRRFACQCAREAAKAAGVPLTGLVVTAERFAAGERTGEQLHAARTSAAPAAAGAAAVGVPRCMPAAAALLSAWHTCDDDPVHAAESAADFAVKACLFKEAQLRSAGWRNPEDRGEPWRRPWHAAAWLRRYKRDLEPVERAVRARHDQWLRGLIAQASGRGRVLRFSRDRVRGAGSPASGQAGVPVTRG